MKQKKKATTLPLTTFLSHADGPPPPAEDGEALPSAPSVQSASAHVGSRKWIAEWDGRAEVLPPDELSTRRGVSAATTVEDFKSRLDACLREFLSGGDLLEATRCVLEMDAQQFHFQVIKRGVTLAMDKAGREREMIAILFATMHARGVLSSAHVGDGFRALLEGLDDLMLDIPSAPSLLSHFLADSHLDGLLPLAHLDRIAADVASLPAASEVIAQARRRLAGRVPLGGSQVERSTARAQLRRVLEEYLSSHDVAEVGRRLEELTLPSDLAHELVRTSIELALERKDYERELTSQVGAARRPMARPPDGTPARWRARPMARPPDGTPPASVPAPMACRPTARVLDGTPFSMAHRPLARRPTARPASSDV